MKNHLLKLSQIIGLSAIFLAPTLLVGQSVQVLQGNYSGNTTWNESTGTLTFSKSGTINLPNKAHNSWAVPNTVKTIIINSDVTVTGRFDVSSKINEPVRAVLDGTVILSTYSIQDGYEIVVQHRNNIISFYKHNSKVLKKVGNFVKSGEAIAIVGNTGENSTGPHLHFELCFNGVALDPVNFISF